jgi:hypothetical protein
VVSADASRYDEDTPREASRRMKKSRSSTNDYDSTAVSDSAGDKWEGLRKKKKEKQSNGGFFGLFGSTSKAGALDESLGGSNGDFEESKKKSKKSKRNSVGNSSRIYDDLDATSLNDFLRTASNGKWA